jgi:uncharacterized ferredoxin-like protein
VNSTEIVAQLMAVAAITAPKTKGENFVQVKILQGESVQALAKAMSDYGVESQKKNFDRDGQNVANSEAVVLIGLKDATTCGLNCGACGFSLCDELTGQPAVDIEFRGPVCAYRLLDMGIALGSAVKVASLLNVDNRIMYRIGAAARRRGLVDWDFVLGVPLSVTGKSIYFDR